MGKTESAPKSAVMGWACAVALMLGSASAVASHVGEDLTTDQQAVASSDQLMRTLRQFERAPQAQRVAQTAQLVQAAAQRRERMLALLERNPRLAAVRVLPAAIRDRMPASVQALVEQRTQVAGTIVAEVAGDVARGTSSTRLQLLDVAGQRFELRAADASEREQQGWIGKRAAVNATRFDRHLLVNGKEDVQLLAADGTATSAATTTAAAAAIQGEQRTLSILLNFNDAQLTCTPADVSSRLFASTGYTVNNNYRESSRGLVGFSGSAVGPFTIDYAAGGSCNYLGWAAAAEAAARAAGIDPAQYTRVNYVTPPNASCGWTGLAYMPGRQSWVQSCSVTGAFSHELGHNLGLNHAATPTLEYGDSSDPMGGGNVSGHNGPNRTAAGWMPAGTVQDVSAGGSYALATLSNNAATGAPQVLRIAKADSSEWYYVSLREAQNLDARLALKFLDTLSIHRSTGAQSAKTYLLQNVAAGQTFNDSVNGIAVTHQGVANGVATVGVSIGGATCLRNAPLISLTPTSQISGAGAVLTYSVSVTNQSSAACGASTFNLTQALPAGFSGSVAAAGLAIAPGASAATTWSVGSASSVADATYTLTLNATDSAGGLGAAAHANTIIDTPVVATCTRSAPQLAVSPASQTGNAGATLPYTLTLTNRNSSGCGNSTFTLAQALPTGFGGTLGAGSVTIAPGTSANVAWSVTTAPTLGAGTFTLNASAAEPSIGMSATAPATAVVVSAADTTAPTLSITSPSAGSAITARMASITVAASDASGVRLVEFYVDDKLLASDTSAPYSANWNLRKATRGGHTIRVRAVDAAGNAAEQTIAVTVN
jgi:Gametolysin peptidase M11/Bacterial Ig domain